MIERLYRGLTTLAAPALVLWLRRREGQGKEDASRRLERRGVASRARPPGKLVWLHAASVGEALSVLALVERLRATWPDVQILFTSGTVTSARLLAERLPPGCFHQYVPLDVPGWVARFLDHWRPGAVLWVESEFWPNTIAEIGARGIPLALINARMSPGSFARWRRVASILRPPLHAFDPCLAQDEIIAARLAALGGRHVQCLGNLKFDAEPLPADEAELGRLRQSLGTRPAWLAASIQPGEAAAVAAAHRALVPHHPGLLTVVVPRHPARGGEIAEIFAGAGLRVGRRSQGVSPAPDLDVYIADTMGELGLFFRLCPIVFMGGSLVPHGGQNALEPARLGAAIVLGPHMHNFPEVTVALLQADAAEQIAGADELAPAIARLLSNPARVTARAAAAKRVAESGRGAVARVVSALAPIFERLPDERAAGAARQEHRRASA